MPLLEEVGVGFGQHAGDPGFFISLKAKTLRKGWLLHSSQFEAQLSKSPKQVVQVVP